MEELIGDERLIDGPARLGHREERREALPRESARDGARAPVARLIEPGASAVLSETAAETVGDAERAGRDTIVEPNPETGEQVPVVNSPVRFLDGGPIPPHRPRRPGRDGPGVLPDPLGLGQAEIGGLRAEDVLVGREANR